MIARSCVDDLYLMLGVWRDWLLLFYIVFFLLFGGECKNGLRSMGVVGEKNRLCGYFFISSLLWSTIELIDMRCSCTIDEKCQTMLINWLWPPQGIIC